MQVHDSAGILAIWKGHYLLLSYLEQFTLYSWPFDNLSPIAMFCTIPEISKPILHGIKKYLTANLEQHWSFRNLEQPLEL